MAKSKIYVRFCAKCNCFSGSDKVCAMCGGKMKKVEKKEIQRFPRLKSKAETENAETIRVIEQTCAEFDCHGKVVKVIAGPVVTQFNFAPSKYVRVKRVRAMSEDLSMALASETVAIMKVPGESSVSIMVPNKERKPILFKDCLDNLIKVRKNYELPLNLGVDSLGNPLILELTKQPHLLVAGSTGSGKSVFLNNLITSLGYVKSPKHLEMYLIDPKSVELTPYKTMPHVKSVETDVWGCLRTLELVIEEMKKRLIFINAKGCKNLKELNDKLGPDDAKPYVVVVIDELAELILAEKKAMIERLASISSVARAAGMHVIAATQRPSVDVLSGKVKVNFPARVAFRVPSSTDAKTIMHTKGAENLLTAGDGFLMSPDRSGIQRFHVPMVEETEVSKLIKLSKNIGHKLNVPADVPKEVQQAVIKEFENRSAAEDKAHGVSLADSMENGKKKNGGARVQ